MSTPFDKASTSIGVTVVTAGPLPGLADGDALLALEPALHDHATGSECVACASRSDIRAMLFDLLTTARTTGKRVAGVVIDATRLADPQPVIDRLSARSPATGLRDFTVARSFHLSRVI